MRDECAQSESEILLRYRRDHPYYRLTWVVDPAVMRGSLDCLRTATRTSKQNIESQSQKSLHNRLKMLVLIVHILGKRFLVTAFAQIVIVIETFTGWVAGALGLNCVTGIRVQEGTSLNGCSAQTDSGALDKSKLTDLAFCHRPLVIGCVLFSYE